MAVGGREDGGRRARQLRGHEVHVGRMARQAGGDVARGGHVAAAGLDLAHVGLHRIGGHRASEHGQASIRQQLPVSQRRHLHGQPQRGIAGRLAHLRAQVSVPTPAQHRDHDRGHDLRRDPRAAARRFDGRRQGQAGGRAQRRRRQVRHALADAAAARRRLVSADRGGDDDHCHVERTPGPAAIAASCYARREWIAARRTGGLTVRFADLSRRHPRRGFAPQTPQGRDDSQRRQHQQRVARVLAQLREQEGAAREGARGGIEVEHVAAARAQAQVGRGPQERDGGEGERAPRPPPARGCGQPGRDPRLVAAQAGQPQPHRRRSLPLARQRLRAQQQEQRRQSFLVGDQRVVRPQRMQRQQRAGAQAGRRAVDGGHRARQRHRHQRAHQGEDEARPERVGMDRARQHHQELRQRQPVPDEQLVGARDAKDRVAPVDGALAQENGQPYRGRQREDETAAPARRQRVSTPGATATTTLCSAFALP